MNNPFQTVAEFLEHYDGEVEGRSVEDASPEVRARLRRFAQGSLAEAERQELVHLLRDHPQWVSLLAAEVKALRPS